MKYIKGLFETEKITSDLLTVKRRYIRTEKGDRTIEILSFMFLFAYYVLPQYFGVHIGFDFTAQRLLVVIFMLYLLENRKRMQTFAVNVLPSPGLIWLVLYFVVLAYTAVLRVHLNSFLYTFFEIVGLYIVVYIAKNGIGIKRVIRILNAFGLLLCILGVVEYIMKSTPFLYLKTLDGLYAGAYWRSGNYRIMGPANHSLGYGLMLVTFVPFACLDIEKDEINMFANLPYFALLAVNVFLTSSRSTLAVFGVELVLVYVFSSAECKKKEFLAGLVIVFSVVLLILTTWGSSISNYLMLQFAYVFDEIFGTEYAANYGADLKQLYNSREYRKQLPYIFSLGLNPFLGRGSQASFGWVINGWAIRSVDNFYIANYIRFAYPGLITYVMYILSTLIRTFKEWYNARSGLFAAVFIGVSMYFLNVWWLDALMTYKYVYILIAVFLACYDDKNKRFLSMGIEK